MAVAGPDPPEGRRMTGRRTSPVTERAHAFVAARLPDARALAEAVAALVDQPDTLVRELEDGLAALADPPYLDEVRRMTPGLRAAFGVRTPLLRPIHAALRRACRRRPDVALWVAERLDREPYLEVRLLAPTLLRLSLEPDPERSWQLIRGMARAADNWIAVDGLAGVAALGILLESYRWSELEQLVYAPSPWERRFVGSTIASLPFEVVPEDRPRLAGGPALELIGQLIGDADENVQKALSWALRNWTRVDPAGVARFLDEQAARAASDADGHRAWVVRDALSALDAAQAARLRALLAGLRRVPGAPATSSASAASAAFADLIATGSIPAAPRFAGAADHEPERSLTE